MTTRPTKKRIPPWGIGLIGVLVVIFGFYMGFAKKLPFSPSGYEVSAVFENAQNIRVKSPVRVAGVNVGVVKEVTHLETDGEAQPAALIKMELKDDALPVKQDASLQLRPRLFLEGNLFVDLKPGSPQAPELKDGGTIPISQTSSSVQVDQVLTSLQAPVRASLQTFLVEFGDALDKYGGGEGLRATFKSSPEAFRYTAEVNEAFLGTQPGDLTGLIVNLDDFVEALNQNQTQLQDLVTNLATVTGAFGKESDALETAIFELPRVLGAGEPALVKVNNSLPALRAFSREILPGARSASPTLDAANPFIAQLRGLVGPDELRGLVSDLRPAVPSVANLSRVTVPFFEQARALSSCFNNVVIPWSDTTIPNHDSDAPADKVYKATGYGLVGIGGESRSGDANGQYIRVGAGGGTNTIQIPNVPGIGTTVGTLLQPLEGAEPPIESSAKTPFNPTAPCENQDPPNLNSGGPVPVPGQASGSSNRAATLPEDLQPFADKQGALQSALFAAQQEGGAEGDAQAQEALRGLQKFYKNQIPEYKRILQGGGE